MAYMINAYKVFDGNKHKHEDNIKMNLTGWYLNKWELLHLLHFMHNVSTLFFPAGLLGDGNEIEYSNRFSLCDICGTLSSEYEECYLQKLQTFTLLI
jgi:hypothetical protein